MYMYWGWWREGGNIGEKMCWGIMVTVAMLILAFMSASIVITFPQWKLGTASVDPLMPGVLGLGVAFYGILGILAVSSGILWVGVGPFFIAAALLLILVSHATNLREQCSAEDGSD